MAGGAAGGGALLLYDSDSAGAALFCFAWLALCADRVGKMRGALPVAVAQVVREVLTVGRFAICVEMKTGGRFFPFFLLSRSC